jgi:hypothetical protein
LKPIKKETLFSRFKKFVSKWWVMRVEFIAWTRLRISEPMGIANQRWKQ